MTSSVFNESIGSCKQTYSRLCLTPRKSLSSSSSLPRRTPADDNIDPERTENHQIIGLLKQLFAPKTSGDDDLVPIRVEYSELAPEFPSAGRGSVGEGNRYKAHFDFSHRLLLLRIHLPVKDEFALEIAGEYEKLIQIRRKTRRICRRRYYLRALSLSQDRLKYVLKAGLFEIDDSDMTEGQTNDFLRDIVKLKKRQKSGVMGKRQKGGEDEGEDKEEEEEGGSGGEGGSLGVDYDKDLKSMKANFEDLCDEDKILVFFKRLLNEWNQELNEMGEAERRTAKGKSIVATFKQCARVYCLRGLSTYAIRDAEEYKNFCDLPKDQRSQLEEVIGDVAEHLTTIYLNRCERGKRCLYEGSTPPDRFPNTWGSGGRSGFGRGSGGGSFGAGPAYIFH
ncbi:hypothetical protein RHGRI_026213 [Rhododendron griersonianum]|uniref:Uncharacterized protein n=1 Tax=Rhododendron griersonianum TaxID=479676 RepID=A0AAV6IVF7_9ERIC|nr:hypothetical protein RHGRI_026213 [Rhododendron griersonianum]